MSDVMVDDVLYQMEKKDVITAQHMRKTLNYTHWFSDVLCENKAIKLSSKAFDQCICLHDVGKFNIPTEILQKPGRLSDAEYAEIKTHTLRGARFIETLMKIQNPSSFLVTAYNVTKYHHERWDGTGYPCGLAGEEIPLVARMAAIIDVYEALTGERTYRKAVTPNEAVTILQSESGKQFDGYLVDCFYDAFQKECRGKCS